MFGKKVGLYVKLLFLAGIMAIVMIVVLLMNIYSYKVEADKDTISATKTLILECYGARSVFSKTRDTLIANEFIAYMNKFEEQLKSYENNEITREVFQLRNDYLGVFDEYLKAIRKRGLNEDRGIEGRFRTNIHNIEYILDSLGQSELLVHMLQARRSEKDFIMRRRDKYIKKNKAAIISLKTNVHKLNLDPYTKAEIVEYADSYLMLFGELVDMFKSIDSLAVTLEGYEQRISDKLDILVDEKYAEANFTQMSQFGIAILSIIFGIAFSLIIARQISRPVVRLKDAAHRIAGGKLDTEVLVETNDEIADLAHSFNNMAKNVKSSNETILNQQKELLTKNTKLQGLTDDLTATLRDLSLLSEIGRNITSALNFDDIFKKLYSTLKTLIDSYIFRIGIYDNDKKQIRYKLVIINSKQYEPEIIDMSNDSRLDVICLKEGKEIYIKNINKNHEELKKKTKGYLGINKDIQSLFYLPIFFENQIMGILTLESTKKKAFRKANVELIRNLGSYVAIATKNAKSYEQAIEANKKLRETQKQLIQAEKLASLGQLTTGIAHEIKNPLNFIMNYAEGTIELFEELEEIIAESDSISKETLDEINDATGGLKKYLTTVYNNGKRIDSIVKSMMEHARGGSDEKLDTDLNYFVKEYATMAYKGFVSQYKDFRADINYGLHNGELRTMIRQEDLSRVITNIVDNACYESMKRKKKENDFVPSLEIKTENSDGTAKIKIKDYGYGMPESVKEKIFNPFFTTKPTGEGTGLGLSLSYDIVTNGHNGNLLVESQENQFTEFTIILPILKT